MPSDLYSNLMSLITYQASCIMSQSLCCPWKMWGVTKHVCFCRYFRRDLNDKKYRLFFSQHVIVPFMKFRLALEFIDFQYIYLFIFDRYPIYHIPARRNVKDLSACFLTYHTISSAFQGMHSRWRVKQQEWKFVHFFPLLPHDIIFTLLY